jgi:type IV secretion system protein VirB5
MAQPHFATSGPLETPYLRAMAVWDARLGSARVQARNWRLTALGTLLLNLVLAGGLLWHAAKAQVVPYVIEVDTQGQVRTVGPAQVAYVPQQAAIQRQVREFVEAIRALPADPVVLRKQWLRAYAIATPKGARLLTAYAREQDPFRQVGQQTIAVEVTRVLSLSETSCDVQWTETVYDMHGVQTTVDRYSGLFTVILHQPTTEQEITDNPLGIWLETFSWAKRP